MKSSAVGYRLRPRALVDVEEIVEQLRGAGDPLLALRFIEAAQATFESLAFAPKAYPRFESADARLQGMRFRPLTGSFERYLVFYRLDDENWVEVARVVHAARDLRRVLDVS